MLLSVYYILPTERTYEVELLLLKGSPFLTTVELVVSFLMGMVIETSFVWGMAISRSHLPRWADKRRGEGSLNDGSAPASS